MQRHKIYVHVVTCAYQNIYYPRIFFSNILFSFNYVLSSHIANILHNVFHNTAPALVLALRGVNAFQKLEHFLSLPEQTTAAKQISESATLKSCTLHKVQHPMKLMTKSADEAYTLLRLFFGSDEIFPNADCRCLLQYLPESRHYHSSSEWNQLRLVDKCKGWQAGQL